MAFCSFHLGELCHSYLVAGVKWADDLLQEFRPLMLTVGSPPSRLHGSQDHSWLPYEECEYPKRVTAEAVRLLEAHDWS